jgi:antitoxin VapB
MALSIKDPEADQLARDLARLTGESLTGAVTRALSERLERERKKRGKPGRVAEELERIVAELKRAPVLDARTAEEIIGYDEHGLPG